MKKYIGIFSFLVAVVLCYALHLGRLYQEEQARQEYPILVRLSPRTCWLDTKQWLDITAKMAVEDMIIDAGHQGFCLVVTSGYRSVEEQEMIRAKYGKLAKEPGDSEHHTGMAVDLTACPMLDGMRDDGKERLELEKPFGELPEYQWLKENANNYGFSQSYPNEPWHWKYEKNQ